MATPLEGATASGAARRSGGEKRRRRSEQSRYRDWSGLPEPALFSVAMFLTGSLADVLAFGRVCRAWRSVARAAERDLMSCLPPLIFRSRDANFYCPADGRSYRNGRVTALLGGEWGFEMLGFSFGHIIVTHLYLNQSNPGTFSIVNPLTVTSAHARQFPRIFLHIPGAAVLSSHPASPDCVLWFFDGGFLMEYCGLGDQKWTTFSSERYYSGPPVFFRDKGYVICEGKVAVFDIDPCSFDLTILPMRGCSCSDPLLQLRLCASDAELLLVRVVRHKRYWRIRGFQVYRFDFSAAGWVRLDSLGNRALFWDAFSVTLSENPGTWGGCGNCVYFVDEHDDRVCVFHLKDGKMECLFRGSPSNPKFPFQSPVWIHPSMCY